MKHILTALLLTFTPGLYANVSTLIIDTGAGFASITRFPNDDIMVFDTGHWNLDTEIFEQFENFIGDNDIDLLIVSHTDSDHLAATDELFNRYRIHRVIRTGYIRDTNTWRDHNQAIQAASNAGQTHDINLAHFTLPHGTQYHFGDATVSYLSGFHQPPAEWGLEGSEFLNGSSIVVRVTYKEQSILFTGDAVGRHEGAPQDAEAIATERYLIDHAQLRPIQSSILIAPHHGSDDASSTEFIQTVAPRWVIFTAGSQHHHPRNITAQRYLNLGLSPNCLLRTDRGDDEGGQEWNYAAIPGHKDSHGDDNIEITLNDTGTTTIHYAGSPDISCPQIIPKPALTHTDLPVKKSSSGICHSPTSPWYTRTKKFKIYNNLQDCLDSGGRNPR